MDGPWLELEDWEKDSVLDGPEEKKHITVTSKKWLRELDFTFRNARPSVTKELERANSEKRLSRVSRILKEGSCPARSGSRLSEAARAPEIDGVNLAQASAIALSDLLDWVRAMSESLPGEMGEMAGLLVETMENMGKRLIDLELSYLPLDRSSSTLSAGERQRAQLARSVRNRTTGVLYVLHEPSIGMHPVNIDGLLGVMRDLLEDGNSVVFVDHDVQALRQADWLIEIGPGSGTGGGEIIAQARPSELGLSSNSQLAGFLTGEDAVHVRPAIKPEEVFEAGELRMTTSQKHTVHPSMSASRSASSWRSPVSPAPGRQL